MRDETTVARGRPLSAPGVATTAVLTATVAAAAACWVVALTLMDGMDMGVATRLGSLGLFLGAWAAMMGAMMLPGAAPAALRRVRSSSGLHEVPLFLGSYLAVWVVFGLVVYALDRPHGTAIAGAVAIAAGVYELTPLKRHFRRRCRETSGSGLEFGRYCMGSGIGLMLMMTALGAMSVTWMAVLAVVALVQKLLPARTAIDVPLALAIVGLGVLILIAPASVPGLTPAM